MQLCETIVHKSTVFIEFPKGDEDGKKWPEHKAQALDAAEVLFGHVDLEPIPLSDLIRSTSPYGARDLVRIIGGMPDVAECRYVYGVEAHFRLPLKTPT